MLSRHGKHNVFNNSVIKALGRVAADPPEGVRAMGTSGGLPVVSAPTGAGVALPVLTWGLVEPTGG